MAAFKTYLQDQTKSTCINTTASRSPQRSPHTRSFATKKEDYKLCIILEHASKENMKTEILEYYMFNGIYEIGYGVKLQTVTLDNKN